MSLGVAGCSPSARSSPCASPAAATSPGAGGAAKRGGASPARGWAAIAVLAAASALLALRRERSVSRRAIADRGYQRTAELRARARSTSPFPGRRSPAPRPSGSPRRRAPTSGSSAGGSSPGSGLASRHAGARLSRAGTTTASRAPRAGPSAQRRRPARAAPDREPPRGRAGRTWPARWRLGERAIALAPGRPELYSALGVLLSRPVSADAAASVLERGRRHFPESAELVYNSGVVAAIQGQPERRRGSSRRALELEPGHRKARENLAGMLARPGATTRRSRSIDGRSTRRPHDRDLRVLLARALAELGRVAEARAELETRARRDPGHRGGAEPARGSRTRRSGRTWIAAAPDGMPPPSDRGGIDAHEAPNRHAARSPRHRFSPPSRRRRSRPPSGPDVTVFSLNGTQQLRRARRRSRLLGRHDLLQRRRRRPSTGATTAAAAARADHATSIPSSRRTSTGSKNGRFEQIGMSWLKHGFVSTNSTPAAGCQRPHGQSCDPAAARRQPARRRLHRPLRLRPERQPPARHALRGQRHDRRSSPSPTRRCLSPTADRSADARSTRPTSTRRSIPARPTGSEGQYISDNDALAGNGLNNASYARSRSAQRRRYNLHADRPHRPRAVRDSAAGRCRMRRWR